MLSWLFDQSLQTYFQINGFSQVMPMNNNKSSDNTKEPHPVRLRSLEDEYNKNKLQSLGLSIPFNLIAS